MDVERADISFALPLFWSCEYSHDMICTLNCCLVCIKNQALSCLRLEYGRGLGPYVIT